MRNAGTVTAAKDLDRMARRAATAVGTKYPDDARSIRSNAAAYIGTGRSDGRALRLLKAVVTRVSCDYATSDGAMPARLIELADALAWERPTVSGPGGSGAVRMTV